MFIPSLLLSQDHLGDDRITILNDFTDYVGSDSNYQIDIEDHTNVISISIIGECSLNLTYFLQEDLDGSISEESFCDSAIMRVLCAECVDSYLAQLLESRNRRWTQVSETEFVSKRWVRKFNPKAKGPNLYTIPCLEVLRTDVETVVTLYMGKWTRREWKAILKSHR